MSTPQNVARHDLGDGSSLLVAGYDDEDALTSVERQLKRSVDTPTPSGDSSGSGGPITRASDAATVFGIRGIRTLGLQSHELGDAIRTRRNELYRNEFPKLKPRFVRKCGACEAELDTDATECPVCGSTDLREPDPAEKREAEQLFKSVNREGQSLRELAKYCEPDQWTAGVSCIVIQYDYAIARGSTLYDDGEVIAQDPQELVYGDPSTIKPVVDADGRVGGHWWTCPIHRENPANEPGHCETCGAELREVYFAEKTSDSKGYYFRDEVVTWAYPMPRLRGLDGLTPISGVMIRQVILEMMTRYGAAFYDQESDRLPNQLMILHTTNADHWEDQLDSIREDDDPYDSPILSNEYSPEDSTTPELQVIDAMPDELLGQSESLKQAYKEDIRQAIGISNVHDSDLSDAGGLNNEGLQLEVTDRAIASQQHDYVEGWLDTLAKRLDIEDWYIDFLPATGPDTTEKKEAVRTGALAAQAGLDARWEDGDISIDDGEFDASDPDAGPKADIRTPGADGDDADAGDTTPPPTPADQQAYDLSPRQTVDLLSDAYRHIVWADSATEQQAQPFWSRDEDVPANVERHIESAIRQTDLTMADEVSGAQLTRFFREKLTQRQGWSLSSLARDLGDNYNLEQDYAETVSRSGAARILNRAKLLAFQELEDDAGQEVLYFWRGPETETTTEACSELKELTNPEFGGTPRPLEEFRELQREIQNKHFPDLRFEESSLHPNERHTIEAVLASQVDDAAA
ncbi:MAG: hypothetical protein V5A34_05640 [Halapricum sp.]